jgi:gamma-glutamylcyclotransferase (GGCT)/AIG2-like uncharacterized protein YtfP
LFGEVVMTRDFFAYGTLMCEDIMLAVTGRRLGSLRGFLRDYQRRTVKGEVYPGLIPGRGGIVEGIVYRDLRDADWALLDTFEGEMYQRQIVHVNLEDRTSIEAHTYVVRPEFVHRLEASEWDFAKFRQCGKGTFEKQYAGFNALKNGPRT